MTTLMGSLVINIVITGTALELYRDKVVCVCHALLKHTSLCSVTDTAFQSGLTELIE